VVRWHALAALVAGVEVSMSADSAKRQIDPVEITVDCSATTMPAKLPASGTLITVIPFPGAGGSTIKNGEVGEAIGWGPLPAFKCEVRNLSGKVLPAIKITLPVEYRERDGSPFCR
jgi:hypothetical protein